MPVDTMELICYISYRLSLPAVLAVAAFIRVSFVSLIWLMFFLALPCLPKFSYKNWVTYRSLRIYILLLLIISTLACCGHIVYWVLEVSTSKLDISVATMCNSTNILLMNIGYQSLSPDIVPSILDRIRLIMPDFVVFIVSVVTTILCFNSPVDVSEQTEEGVNLSKVWRTLEPFVTAVFLFLAGAAAPSLVSGFYFVTFMVIATLWALGVKLGKLPHLKLFLLVMSGLQIIALYLYQFRDMHTRLKRDTLIARLLGFVQYYDRSCEYSAANDTLIENPLHLTFTDNLIVGNFAFVFALGALYFSLGLSARYMIKISRAICRLDSEEHEALLNSRHDRSRSPNTYNTINVDAALEDAAAIRGSVRGSIRSRTSSFASSYHAEEEGTLNQIFRFITKLLIDQVYLITLAVLMLWSITYISWMEFVLLVLVCFLCICPKAKEASYSVAYPLVGYCTILVTIQYIYGLDLTEEELREKGDVGLKRDEERGKPVLFKTIFLSVFWLHLRAYLYQQNNIVGNAANTLRHNHYTVQIYHLYRNIKYIILTYWPVVCYATLLLAALHSKGINIMRIIYLAFFAVFMFCYVVARKPLELRILWLWYLLIMYVMYCVIMLYTYQFEQIRDLWTTNVDVIEDIGLSKVTATSELFIALLVPILVLLAVTIQLRVFRAPPEEDDEQIVAEPEPPAPEQEPETIESDAEVFERRRKARLKSSTYMTMTNLATNVTETMKEFWSDSKTVAARGFHISLAIMEMHSPKFVSLAVFWVCVWRVNVINVVLLLITVVTLPWPLVQYKLTIPIFCWVCWEVFTQLIYQLNMIKSLFSTYLEHYITIPCSNQTDQEWKCGYKEKSDFEWLGYYRMENDTNTNNLLDLENKPWNMVWGYMLVIALLVMQRLLVHYMKTRNSRHIYILREGIFPDFLFPNITRENAEKKISLQLMYLCNNFFVLFGREIVYIMHVLVAAVRYDVYGCIYIVLLGIWKNLSAQNKSKTCMAYIVLINVLISIQYLLLVGLPPGLCLEYPWCALQTQKKASILIWLYLPTTPSTSNQYFLFADFVLLLGLTRMWHVFTLQKLDDSLGGALLGSAGPDFTNPHNNSTLNRIKFFIFTYLWWITAAVLFLNAVMSISIFSAGFLIATFALLWYGSSLLTKTKEILLNRWEMILVYAYFVMLFKILLQLPSCIDFQYDKDSTYDKLRCPLADIFKLICLQEKPKELRAEPFGTCDHNYSKSTGLVMDALTFAFVVIQIRVFNSPYFKHAQSYLKVLIETSATGAMIMKQRMSLRTKMNFDAEEKRLRHIKEHVAILKSEHDSRTDFDFGMKELTSEALAFWAERDRRVSEAARKHTQMYGTHEELHMDSDIISYEEKSEEGSYHEIEGDVGGGAPDEENDEPVGPGSETETDADGPPKEVPVWTPKPHKPEKPTEEIIVEVLEFSHQSFVSFLEFAISWLDDKSGDYRYTSMAIFKERYNKPSSSTSWSPTVRSCKADESDILEEVAPSCAPNEHIVWRLCVAIYYFCQARTELLCFLFMILNHIMNASIISMFYPVIAMLWGMVAFPRPSGIFWYIVIVYCKISIICKYVFQFNSISWNNAQLPEHASDATNPMWLPNLLGLTKTNELFLRTAWDLLILMSVFFHKSCLETAGIWSVWYNTLDDLEEANLGKIASPSSTNSATRMIGNDLEETSLVGDLQVDDEAIVNDGQGNGERGNDFYEEFEEVTVDFTLLAKINFVMFCKLLIDKTKKDNPKDLYLPMYISTLLALLVTLLGWNAFGKVEGQEKLDVSEIISTNYIPSVFLIILLVQFMLMIVDRIIYLKKSMIAKYIYQVLVVGILHAYLFIFQPWFTRESFSSMAAWIAWYIFFCCYFTLSAFQIQAGYPRLSTDSIILRTYGYVTYWIYLGYLAVPFLWELEVLLNWVCTETTLTLDYWVKYSDIKAWLFKLKCWQVTYESAYYLGEKQPAYMKYGIGGLIVLVLILIIWFPLLFMSVVTTNSVANPPVGFSCQLSVSGLEPLVNMRVAQMPEALSDQQLDVLKKATSNNGEYSYNNYTEFVGKFKNPDVVRLDLSADSTTLWEVSPAAVSYLKRYLGSASDATNYLTLRFDWTIIRDVEAASTASKSVSGYSELPILTKAEARTITNTYVEKSTLLSVIKDCVSTKVNISGLIPTFLYAKESGSSPYIDLFPRNKTTNFVNSYNVKWADLILNNDYADPEQCKIWNDYYWSFNQKSNFITPFNSNMSQNKVQFFIFSDRIISSQYQLIAGYGIIGLYISVVLVIWKFVRLVLADSSTRIMFQEMPNPDLIMKLVSSTEMVRAQSEFVLEQVLFRKLLLLYRSPETLIVWTGRHRHLKEE